MLHVLSADGEEEALLGPPLVRAVLQKKFAGGTSKAEASGKFEASHLAVQENLAMKKKADESLNA